MTLDIPAALMAAARPGLWHNQNPAPDTSCLLPPPYNTVCAGGQLGLNAAGDAIGSEFDKFVQSLIDGLGSVLRWDLSWWTNLPSPELASASGEPGPVLTAIQSYTGQLQVVLLTAGIMFAAARLALAKRGGLAGEAQESFLVFARAVFASMTFASVVTIGTRAGDAFSSWVIFDASRGDANQFAEMLTKGAGNLGLGTGVLLVVGLLGLISMLVQLVMLVVRQAFLIVVVAALPIAAAAAGTGPGGQAYKRMLGWSLAFLLWKPVGALCYAIAFSTGGAAAGPQQRDPQMLLLALILLLTVALVLPALMRLIAPAVASLGGGSGAAATLAGGALGLAMGRAGGGDGGAQARNIGENDGIGGGGGASPPPSSPSPDGGNSGGGRRMSGGNDTAGTGDGGGASAAGRSSGAPSSAGADGARTVGHEGGAAGAGAAGPVMAGAQAVGHGAQQFSAAAQSQTRDTGEAGMDPDAPGPMEVRR
ncbi:hypothetical protein K7711_36565 [Nocardia sp. CA2R105]|uniref:hypothetical protein n=1 Tax=Nocardia coffeae TaxID=2873381 RepID=UPI001CA793A6|nr:hypothetical protein [Nocardia coffeae]MBY8862038.1 hypothetical protein [Nocardia coffeae]